MVDYHAHLLVDYHAERMLISITLHGRTEEFLALPPGVFDHWISRAIANAIRTILGNGSPLDLPVVARALTASMGTGGKGQEVGKALFEVYTMLRTAEAAPYYAERLLTLHGARQFKEAMYGFVGRMIYGVENDDPLVKKRALAEAKEAIDEVDRVTLVAEAEVMSALDFIELPTTAHDWLVPDLMERTDRLILTGLEGTGKSMLLAQLALTIGAGIHPFLGIPLPSRPYQAMIIDCENSPRQIQRRMRSITAQVDALRKREGMEPADWGQCVRIVSRPEGVSISDPREYARLDHMIASVNPDIVVMGPLYKMSKLDYRDEQAAKEVTDALDALRIQHQFALVTEAHTGHAQDAAGTRSARPLGSSLFLRWPEFGLGLLPAEGFETEEHPSVVKVRRWRGSREERNWPFTLTHGDDLPWVPAEAYVKSVPADLPSGW